MIAQNTRRQFLKTTATATAAIAAANLTALTAKERPRGVAVVLDPHETTQRSVPWAAGQLRDALKDRGAPAEIFDSLEQAPPAFDCVLAASRASTIGKRALDAVAISLPDAPEAIGLGRGWVGNRAVLLACGSDTRGMVYALLELADRVNFARDPQAELQTVERTIEQPATA